jgi:hypothetical protein
MSTWQALREIFSPSNKLCPLLAWTDVYLAGSAGQTSKFLSPVCYLPMGCVHVLINSCCESEKERHFHEMDG